MAEASDVRLARYGSVGRGHSAIAFAVVRCIGATSESEAGAEERPPLVASEGA